VSLAPLIPALTCQLKRFLQLVRAVFTIARRLSPCVVFLDEIDALFGARVSSRGSGGAIAHRGVITEFMQEMDGLKTREDANVMVIGATNRCV